MPAAAASCLNCSSHFSKLPRWHSAPRLGTAAIVHAARMITKVDLARYVRSGRTLVTITGTSRLPRSWTSLQDRAQGKRGLDSVVSASDQGMNTAQAPVATNLRTLVSRALGSVLGGVRHPIGFADQCRFGG